ncbi:hypothetical protein FPZ12_042295 [Amycolatopsis acidicola]|uniref:VOC domain-containing protein n=1 Tax=Amycolatopsis acidicola TaxID=2596893 RepID=A0A5N0UKC0_9PSEU|nr:VOC family protein [Amycolatopsis acidicola]KAA9149887.1 hypothetical protein FPZ12_042295 [Amycolatopsis acidicola]
MPIGKLFHLIQLSSDVRALEEWYADVFPVRTFFEHNYSEQEKRDASLILVGDSVLEPAAPAFREPGWEASPLGRFYRRFGPHWHSIAWYTDDAGEIWERCTAAGIRVLADERPAPDGIVMTHPKDTLTQLQFMGPHRAVRDRDPRLRRDWNVDGPVDGHPLGCPGLAYTTVLARDLERAERIYAGILGGTVLHRDSSALTGTDDSYVQLGDTVVQLSTPNTDGTLAAADLAACNEIHHAAAFRVRDVDVAAEYLAAKRIRVTARDEYTLLTDPATTHGVPFRWTSRDVPGV